MSEQQHKEWIVLQRGDGLTIKLKAERALRVIKNVDDLVEDAKTRGVGIPDEELDRLRFRILREED